MQAYVNTYAKSRLPAPKVPFPQLPWFAEGPEHRSLKRQRRFVCGFLRLRFRLQGDVVFRPELPNREYGFDFHGRAEGKTRHADGTAGAYSGIHAENVGKKLAAAVDHRRLTGKVGRAVHHAQ